MNIFINGQPFDTCDLPEQNIRQALTLFLDEEQQKQPFAVALNGDFVGKPDYDSIQVNQGDSLDVLFPIQGG